MDLKILVPVDFSDISNVLLRTAKKVAEAHKGEVVLFHAVSPAIYIPYPESVGVDVIDIQILKEIEESKKQEAEEKIKGFLDFLKPVPARYRVDVGDARDLILEIEEEENPDLMILGSHKKGLIEKILIGSTAEKVVKHAKKPVLVVKGEDPDLGGEIVIAYDFSKTAEKTLNFALDFFAPFLPKVHLLHIDEPLEIPVIEKIGKAIYKKYREEKKKHMTSVVDRIKSRGFDVEDHFLEGKDPAQEIVSFIEDHPSVSLLVMGSKGISGLKRILLGSTSTEVINRANIPILIYKDKEGR